MGRKALNRRRFKYPCAPWESASKSAAPGCVDVVGPSTMGAANYHACGRQAARFCAAQSNRDDHFAEAAQAACRKAGV